MSIIKNSKSVKYVVIRDGYRVSDEEYNRRDDAQDEYDFWNRVVTKCADGTKVEIVEKDSKKHKVYHLK